MGELEPRPLDALAAEINAEHRAFVGLVRKTLEQGIRTGELLVQAKDQCRHGTWLPWLEKHFEGSVRVAQEYMRLYNLRDELRGKTRDSTHLSVSGALKELASPSEAGSREDTQDEVKAARTGASLDLAAEKRAITQAVAAAHGMSLEETQETLSSEVREVRNAVIDKAERRVEEGKSFDADERAEYASRLAEWRKRTREREARYREERRKKHTQMFLEVDAYLGGVRREAKEALDHIRGVEFDSEELELLERQGEAALHMVRLVLSALAGDSGTDWDAELRKLEERRQWGDDPPEHE